MPNLTPARIGYNEYKSRRIAGAVFWNVDVIAEPSKEMGLSHMLPSGKKFVQAARELFVAVEGEWELTKICWMMMMNRTIRNRSIFPCRRL